MVSTRRFFFCPPTEEKKTTGQNRYGFLPVVFVEIFFTVNTFEHIDCTWMSLTRSFVHLRSRNFPRSTLSVKQLMDRTIFDVVSSVVSHLFQAFFHSIQCLVKIFFNIFPSGFYLDLISHSRATTNSISYLTKLIGQLDVQQLAVGQSIFLCQ